MAELWATYGFYEGHVWTNFVTVARIEADTINLMESRRDQRQFVASLINPNCKLQKLIKLITFLLTTVAISFMFVSKKLAIKTFRTT